MAPGEGCDVPLSWIVVCHESARDLGVLMPSLVAAMDALSARGTRCELIVVDNASSDGSASEVRRRFADARVVRLGHNVGYGAAINRAARIARGRWLVVGNADLFVPRGGLDALPEVLAGVADDVAVIGPAIHGPDGRLGLSAGRFPNLATLLTGLARPCHRRKYLHERHHRQGEVDWVTGACQLVRRDVFEAVGGFDPGFFLYYEDVDLARRLRQEGFRSLYEPSLAVVHVRPHHGRPPQSDIETIVRASRSRYFRQHRPRWEIALLEVLARLEPLVRRRSRGAVSEPAPELKGWVAPGRRSAGPELAAGVVLGGAARRRGEALGVGRPRA